MPDPSPACGISDVWDVFCDADYRSALRSSWNHASTNSAGSCYLR